MPAKRPKRPLPSADAFRDALGALAESFSGLIEDLRRAPRRQPTRRPPAEQLERCEACGAQSTRICEDCGACPDCCWCSYSALFDADELGLDPETDDQRLYDQEDEDA